MTSLGVIGPPQSEQHSVSGILEPERESIYAPNANAVRWESLEVLPTVQVVATSGCAIQPVDDGIGTIVSVAQHGLPRNHDFGPVLWWRPAFIFEHAVLYKMAVEMSIPEFDHSKPISLRILVAEMACVASSKTSCSMR